jgi:predicted nucleotidyltransferase
MPEWRRNVTKEQTKILEKVENAFLPVVKETFSDKLTSVVLYGSAVKGRFTDGISDVNVLILIAEESPGEVVALGKKAARAIWKNRITPLILTVDEFVNSADVFPMEYLDIRHSRKVIYGTDVTEKLEITKDNLRHQVEEQLRGSITSLRRILLLGRGKASTSKRSLKKWFGAQNALFRGLLRLKGEEEVPSDPGEIASKLAEAFDVSADSLLDILRLRNGEKLDPNATAEGLLLLLATLARSVDSMDT